MCCPIKSRTPFLNLPGEVKNIIYRLLLVTTRAKSVFEPEGFLRIRDIFISILSVNRQIYKESLGIAFQENRFILFSMFLVCRATVDLTVRLFFSCSSRRSDSQASEPA